MSKGDQGSTDENASKLAARLAAVQGYYQMKYNLQPVRSVVDEYINRRSGMKIDGETMVKLDPVLFKEILTGLVERIAEIEAVYQAHIGEQKQGEAPPEPILESIMMCGLYEIFAHQEIDTPIIINDYMHVANSFFEGRTPAYVNAILDEAKAVLR